MNKEITIYDLLGLIKDDKAPKKIKYEYLVYELTFERNDYYCKQEMRWFTSEINSLGVLNNKVEILEEDKDIELLNLDTDKLKGKEVIRAIDYLLEGKINELVKEVNKLIKENNNG